MQPVPFTPHPQAAYEASRRRGRARSLDPSAEAVDVVATIQQMINGGYERWHQEWIAAADRIRNDAALALALTPTSRVPSCPM